MKVSFSYRFIAFSEYKIEKNLSSWPWPPIAYSDHFPFDLSILCIPLLLGFHVVPHWALRMHICQRLLENKIAINLGKWFLSFCCIFFLKKSKLNSRFIYKKKAYSLLSFIPCTYYAFSRRKNSLSVEEKYLYHSGRDHLFAKICLGLWVIKPTPPLFLFVFVFLSKKKKGFSWWFVLNWNPTLPYPFWVFLFPIASHGFFILSPPMVLTLKLQAQPFISLFEFQTLFFILLTWKCCHHFLFCMNTIIDIDPFGRQNSPRPWT